MESRLEEKMILEYKLKTRQECVQALGDSVPRDCLLNGTNRQLKVALLRRRTWCYWSAWTVHWCQQHTEVLLWEKAFSKKRIFVDVKVPLVTQGFEADAQEKRIPSEVQV